MSLAYIVTQNALSHMRMFEGLDDAHRQVMERRVLSQGLKESALSLCLAPEDALLGLGDDGDSPGRAVSQMAWARYVPNHQFGNVTYGVPETTTNDLQPGFSNFWFSMGGGFDHCVRTGSPFRVFPQGFPYYAANMAGAVTDGSLQSPSQYAGSGRLNGLGYAVSQYLLTGPFYEYTNPEWEPSEDILRQVAHRPSLEQSRFSGRLRLFGVPLTNFTQIAYGFSSSGTSRPQAGFSVSEAVPGVDQRLVTTMRDASRDPTLFADLLVSASPGGDGDSGGEGEDGGSGPAVPGLENLLPYRYREAVSLGWDAFEFMFAAKPPEYFPAGALRNSSVWLDSIARQFAPGVDAEGFRVFSGGSWQAFDFSLPPAADDAWASASLPEGMSYSVTPGPPSRRVLKIKLAEVLRDWPGDDFSRVFYYHLSGAFDVAGVELEGCPAEAAGEAALAPLLFVFHNAWRRPENFEVRLTGPNARPVLVAAQGCEVTVETDGVYGFRGGVFLGPDSTAVGGSEALLYGSLAWYFENPMPAFTVRADESLKYDLAALSPVGVLASARFLRH
ncbi:hypothetical protein OH491_23965 [Termitidicoccus mucosus]